MTIPQTMYALTLKGGGYSGTSEGPGIDKLETWLEGKEVPVPVPGKGQLLIRVIMSNINPSDLHFIKGEYGIARVQGAPAGFEACGEVVAAGEGGEGLVGKRVGFIASGSGSWAEYALTDMANCVPVMDAVRDEDAAALFVNPLTAIAMFDIVKKSGTGAFLMSAAASQLCKLIAGLAGEAGIKAISLVRRDEQIAHLKELGAAYALNVTAPDFKKEIGTIMADEKPRIFLDAVADQSCSDLFFAMPSRARWIIYGKLSSELPVLTQAGQFIFLEKQIEGFWLTKWLRNNTPQENFKAGAEVQQRFASGKWKTEVAQVISLRDSFAQLPAALARANSGKVMLVP